MKSLRVACLIATVAAAGPLGGCANVEPWVMPYEREALADPIMALSRDPMIDGYRNHVRDTREGARGATRATGGGCGCN